MPLADRQVTQARAALAAARASRASELDTWLTTLLAPLPENAPASADGSQPAEPPAAVEGSIPPGDTTSLEGVALAVVGSHARRELTPGGDLDLVLLHRGRADISGIADRIWYPIWDSGLRLDHSVRTADEARAVARTDLKAALGLLSARCVAGDATLVSSLRAAVQSDWRADARTRLPDLVQMCRERWQTHGEAAFLLEPDLKEAHGGLRDVHVMRAAAASWAVPAPDSSVMAAHDVLLDIRHALHSATGRPSDRLVLQEQEAVARALGLPDADALLRALAEAARTITYASGNLWRAILRRSPADAAAGRAADRGGPPAGAAGGRSTGPAARRPVGDGAVEQDGEVVLARGADLGDPAIVPRVAAAAAQAGLPLAPATVAHLTSRAALPSAPWPAPARDALVSLLGAGPAAIAVWEDLDQAGLIVRLLPAWERVRNRPQRNPVHRFTVDRHLVEAAAHAAALTREVARPDLLLIGALLHDIGKGLPGDHSTAGAELARSIAADLGFPDDDGAVLETLVRHHLLLPDTATRRDIHDPVTVEAVTAAVSAVPGRERETVELLAALAIADGLATGPAAWGTWKANLVAELARRTIAALTGGTPPPLPVPSPGHLSLARHDGAAVRVTGADITIAAPDTPGLLWRAAGVLALHRLAVRTARTLSADVGTAVLNFTAVPEYGTPPDPATLEADLRLMLAGRLDVAARLDRRGRSRRVRPGIPVPPPRVTIIADASTTATVIEVRAHDSPGLLCRIGQALDSRALQIRAARVDTLGAEAVDVFYVVDERGEPVTEADALTDIQKNVLAALHAPSR